MGRPVVLSNGQLFVGIDENGQIHDFYYPYVGLENLDNARNSPHKIGVWVDGQFSWVYDGTWQVEIDYEEAALISKVRWHSQALNVTIESNDFVDPEYNAIIRRMTVTNHDSRERDVRLFLHQIFQISRAGRADTALYVPDDNYLLDYKGRCCLLTSGKYNDDGDFDQFAVGAYGIEGKAGTFRDAEDGELSGNAVEHGGVDSILRFKRIVPAGASFGVNYWTVAADSQSDAQVIHTHIKYYSVEDRLQKARDFWRDWLEPSSKALEALPESKRRLIKRCLLVIKAHSDDRGSILASGDSSIFNYGRDYYCYCWPRDAAYAIWPLIRLGLFQEARNFFEFARSTMHHDGYLMHKYQPDRAIGSTWHPLLHNKAKELAIQEDETAIVVFMMGEYFRASHDLAFVEGYYDTFIEPCANFMENFIDEATGLPHASYDLWEQKFLTSTYTVCTVIAALGTASELAETVKRPDDAIRWKRAAERIKTALPSLFHPDGYFRKGLLLMPDGNLEYDDTLDISSLYGPFMFARLPLDDARMARTFERVQRELLNTSPIGGVIRYPGDDYFLSKPYAGNPWIIATMWLAQYYNASGQKDEAQELLDWAVKRAQPSGTLSEQYDTETGQPLGVLPLVWSQAEFINTSLDLAKLK
jgi:GH15 family glucan-1,4-alpha-glucosidase